MSLFRRGVRARFRTHGTISGRTVYLPSVDMTGFFKVHSRHTATLLHRWRQYSFAFLQISVFRFFKNVIYLHRICRFPRRPIPRYIGYHLIELGCILGCNDRNSTRAVLFIHNAAPSFSLIKCGQQTSNLHRSFHRNLTLISLQ